MKAKRCSVYIENMKGDFYLVDINEEEEAAVLELIRQMQGGTIIVFQDKQPMVRTK